jgi:hypothetical protein
MFSPTFVDIGILWNNRFFFVLFLLYAEHSCIAQAEVKTILKEQEIIIKEKRKKQSFK